MPPHGKARDLPIGFPNPQGCHKRAVSSPWGRRGESKSALARWYGEPPPDTFPSHTRAFPREAFPFSGNTRVPPPAQARDLPFGFPNPQGCLRRAAILPWGVQGRPRVPWRAAVANLPLMCMLLTHAPPSEKVSLFVRKGAQGRLHAQRPGTSPCGYTNPQRCSARRVSPYGEASNAQECPGVLLWRTFP